MNYVNKKTTLVKTVNHKVELPSTSINFSFQFEISILNKNFSGKGSNIDNLENKYDHIIIEIAFTDVFLRRHH